MSGSILNGPLTSTDGLPQVPGAVSGTLQSPVLTPTGGAGGTPGGTYSGAPVDMSQFVVPLSTLQSTLASSASDLTASKNAGLTGQAAVASGAMQGAQGGMLINAADFVTAQQRKANDLEVYTRFGTTPGAPSAQVAEISARILDSENAISQDRSDLVKKLKTPFLDNPVQWFLNQITAPFDEAILQNEIAGRNDDLDVLHRLAMATQEGVAADAAAAYTVSAVRQAGASQVLLGQATKEAGEAALRVAGVLTGAAQVGGSLGATEFNSFTESIRTSTSVDQETYMKAINIRSAAQERELKAVQTDIANYQSQDLNKRAAATADLDKRIQAIGAITGSKYVNYAEFAATPDTAAKAVIMELMSNPDIQQGMALSSIGPAEAIDLANKLRMPLTPGADLTRQKLTKMENAYITSLGPTAKSLYTPQQLLMNTDNYIKVQLQHEATAIPATEGFYSPPSLLATLSLPGVQGTKLAAALAPIANPTANRDGNYPTRADDVVAAANALITAGKATPAEMAAEISTIYKAIVMSKDTTQAYRLFGIPSAGYKNTYNVTVPSDTRMFGITTKNMLNAAEMETYFTRTIIRENMHKTGIIPAPTMTSPSNMPIQE